MTLATRIGVMNQGRIVQIGAPREIYEFPATRFVADFIGSVNLFAGRLVAQAPGRAQVDCEGLSLPVVAEQDVPAAVGDAVWVAIRPEKIQLSSAPQAGVDNRAEGVIQDIAYLGEQTTYVLRLSSGREVKVTRGNAARRGADEFSRGQSVHLGWDASGPVVGKD